MAAMLGFAATVSFSLKGGADLTITDNDGCTPLPRRAQKTQMWTPGVIDVISRFLHMIHTPIARFAAMTTSTSV